MRLRGAPTSSTSSETVRPRIAGREEVNEVAEALDHVGIERPVGEEERHRCFRVRGTLDAVRRDLQRDPLTGDRAPGLDVDGRAEDPREEQRVPGAPREQLAPVDLEAMGGG